MPSQEAAQDAASKHALLGPSSYDGYIPDLDAVATIRREICEALKRTRARWRSATIDDLVNLGLELQAAGVRHAEKTTREQGPETRE